MGKASFGMLLALPLLAVVSLTDAAGCGIYPDRADIQEQLHLAESEGLFQKLDTCSLCKMLVGYLTDEVKEGKSVEEITKFAINLACPLVKNTYPPDVCHGMVNISAPPVLYILNHTTLDAAQICHTFAGICEGSLPTWTIPIPGDKPPVSPRTPNKGPKKIRILQFSDTHYDPQYAPGSLANCKHPRCCRDTYHDPIPADPKFAGYWGNTDGGYPNASGGCDPPYWTMIAAFQAAAELKPDIIYFTGDIPPHDVWMQTKPINVHRDENTTTEFKNHFPGIPIAYAMGNHESSPVNSFSVPQAYKDGFSMDYLYSVLEKIWTDAGVPAEQGKNIRQGGFYEWFPFKGLRVVALNTNYGMGEDWWTLLDDKDPTGQLAWLSGVLLDAEKHGDKVHLIHHHDAGRPLTSFSAALNQLLTRFENTVVGIFTGHTHKDELKVHFDVNNHTRPVQVTYLCPSINSDGEKSPSFRIYEVDGGYDNATWEVIDSYTYSMNLTLANAGGPPKFPLDYSARDAYKMEDLSPQSWADAAWRMAADPDLYYEYFRHYYSFQKEPVQWYNGFCDKGCKALKMWSFYRGNANDSVAASMIEQRFYKHFNTTA